MRILGLEIRNFRSFADFTLDLGGSSAFVISENGVGKSSLLMAVARALGKDHSAIARADFCDLSLPLEIVVTLGGFDLADQAAFPGLLNFSGKPTLRIGYRAEWDDAEQDISGVHGFPDSGWQKKASREQRDALPVIWVPSWRDPEGALTLGNPGSALSVRLRELNLATETAKALGEIQAACDSFRTAPALASLLKSARDGLARLIPAVPSQALTLGASSASERDLLRQFALLMSHAGPELPIPRQSSGLGHLALFAFALERMAATPKAIALVDEPEISLHPQAQRALAALLIGQANQCLIATHSSNVLDRVDPRQVVRLARVPAVEPVRAVAMTSADAKTFQRFANATSAEAFFARKVVLVEGYSDRLAFIELGRRLGRELDGEGISVLSIEGGSAIGAFLALFGPAGLRLAVSGMCDADKEAEWSKALQATGAVVTSRQNLSQLGYFVCDRDLEDELIRALGVSNAQAVIASEGESKALQKFCAHPKVLPLQPEEQLRLFVQREKVKWAPLLVGALDLKTYKGALRDAVQFV